MQQSGLLGSQGHAAQDLLPSDTAGTDRSVPISLSAKSELLASTGLCHIFLAAPVMDLEETDRKCNSLGTALPVIHTGGNCLWQRWKVPSNTPRSCCLWASDTATLAARLAASQSLWDVSHPSILPCFFPQSLFPPREPSSLEQGWHHVMALPMSFTPGL